MNLKELYKTSPTEQEIVDNVLTALATQRWDRSLEEDESGVVGCAYRGCNGLQCAVGHLMPDEVYRKAYEGQGVFDLPAKIEEESFGMTETEHEFTMFIQTNSRLLTSLQKFHDNYCSSDAAGVTPGLEHLQRRLDKWLGKEKVKVHSKEWYETKAP